MHYIAHHRQHAHIMVGGEKRAKQRGNRTVKNLRRGCEQRKDQFLGRKTNSQWGSYRFLLASFSIPSTVCGAKRWKNRKNKGEEAVRPWEKREDKRGKHYDRADKKNECRCEVTFLVYCNK